MIQPSVSFSIQREVMAARSKEIFTEGGNTDFFSCLFEYETPKVVTIKNVPIGILRVILQLIVIVFVLVYQLWYSQGYQEFTEGETCVTAKVKGFSM